MFTYLLGAIFTGQLVWLEADQTLSERILWTAIGAVLWPLLLAYFAHELMENTRS